MIPLEAHKPMSLTVVQQVERTAKAVPTLIEIRVSDPQRLPDLTHVERTVWPLLGQGRDRLLQ